MSATAVQIGVGVVVTGVGLYTLNPMLVMAGGSMVAGGDPAALAPAPAASRPRRPRPAGRP